MSYAFHPEAEAEFIAAINYYEHSETKLGQDFAWDVYETIERIAAYPDAWPRLEGEIRRCQTKRFPFGVVYAVENGVVQVLAVMHLHRDPDYWKARVKG